MIFYIINAVVVAILSIINYVNDDLIIKYSNNLILGYPLSVINRYKFEIAISCVLYILIYTLLLQWIRPSKGKRKLMRDLLERMNSELFEGDQENHRITLFKEINYFKALIKNYLAFLYHLINVPQKVRLYIKPPRKGRYLGVYERVGLQYKKSSTMLRVEINDPKKCEGVASYIRYKNMAAKAVDLPDITDISDEDLLSANNINDIKRSKRRLVVRYMKEGFLRDFNTLKKIHRRARHFYGTVIYKREKIWGVLLSDSISERSPFDDYCKERFNSFATTISGIINMEV